MAHSLSSDCCILGSPDVIQKFSSVKRCLENGMFAFFLLDQLLILLLTFLTELLKAY